MPVVAEEEVEGVEEEMLLDNSLQKQFVDEGFDEDDMFAVDAGEGDYWLDKKLVEESEV